MKRKTIKIGLIAMVLLVAATLVTATYLTSYGEVRTTANVKQAIVFDGKEDNSPVEHEFEVVGGDCKCVKEIIKNRAPIEGTVNLQTTYLPDGDGITTTIYQVPEFTTLILENKDADWDIIDGDGIQATLTFQTMKTTFDYDFVATGLQANTDYTLLYYADYEDKVNNWGGDNPGAFIAEFTTDEFGDISSTSGTIDLNMNLPSEPDANIAFYDYSGDPDFYNHAHGAKIWLVPSVDYDLCQLKVIHWNPTAFLFETDLVSYSDCNIRVPCWLAPLIGEEITEEDNLVIPAETNIKLIFCYDFEIHIEGKFYTMSTLAIPVV